MGHQSSESEENDRGYPVNTPIRVHFRVLFGNSEGQKCLKSCCWVFNYLQLIARDCSSKMMN